MQAGQPAATSAASQTVFRPAATATATATRSVVMSSPAPVQATYTQAPAGRVVYRQAAPTMVTQGVSGATTLSPSSVSLSGSTRVVMQASPAVTSVQPQQR